MKTKNMTTLHLRKSIGRSPLRLGLLLITLALACFALLPAAQAQLSPPPDGGYPNDNTAEGTDALFSLTTGVSNTAVGFSALFSNTIGGNNTASGADALYSNTMGGFNTADGWQALYSNTTGNSNTATGFVALQGNTTGSNNTATGNGALFSNTTGTQNTANGSQALLSNTTGEQNTAVGSQALNSNTTGDGNTANGFQALYSNTTGVLNEAFGDGALFSNTVGIRNLGLGTAALSSLTDGDSNTAVGNASLLNSGTVDFNTALGRRALYRCQGDQNIGLGFFAGSNLNDGSANNIYIGNVGPVPIGAESNTIRIGTQTPSIATIGNPPVESHTLPAHTATYIAGISETGVRGTPVKISSSGQLGVAPSSARFKQEIQSMDSASEVLLALRPVTFRYKFEIDPEGVPEFGLLAEDVEKVNPDLVVRDKEGRPYTVRYEAVNAMLLNEFLKEHRKVEQLTKDFQSKLAEQQKQIEALTSGLQKVSAQLELSNPAPQTVLNDQ
jgi:hypothetical protein